jgi:hypothetical protein
MTIDDHAKKLGCLFCNFQSLELCLRAFLHNLPSTTPSGVEYGTCMYSLPVGSELNESPFTNYDTLATLIEKYNAEVGSGSFAPIDRTLVEVRDALAHGRVSAPMVCGTLRLIKFTKPKDGRVKIAFSAAMTESWFTHQIERVSQAIKEVNSNTVITKPHGNSAN